MKRLGYTLALSSMLLLTACGSEIETIPNETYHMSIAKSEDSYMEKPTDSITESAIEEDTTSEPSKEQQVMEEPEQEKSDFKKTARQELEKRVVEEKQPKPTEPTSTKVSEKVSSKASASSKKEKVTEKVKVTSNSEKTVNQDWQSSINKISKENIDNQAKIRKLTTFSESYVGKVTQKEVQQFKKTMLDDFNTGNFTASIGNDKAMLTYLLKSFIVAEKTSKQNNYSLYMFMTTFNAFLEDLYLVPNTITDVYLDKQIDKLYRIYTTIE